MGIVDQPMFASRAVLVFLYLLVQSQASLLEVKLHDPGSVIAVLFTTIHSSTLRSLMKWLKVSVWFCCCTFGILLFSTRTIRSGSRKVWRQLYLSGEKVMLKRCELVEVVLCIWWLVDAMKSPDISF